MIRYVARLYVAPKGAAAPQRQSNAQEAPALHESTTTRVTELPDIALCL